MEQEILFRAKAINRDAKSLRTNYKNGDWVHGLVTRLYDERFENLPAEMTNTSGVSCIEVDYKTVGRFTGLTDRNGIKIFEGDCLRSIKESGFSIVQHGLFIPQFFYECVYEAKGFDLRNKVFGFYCEDSITKEQLLLTDYVSDAFVVIGNIHDNPELLKGEPNV